MQSLIKRFGEDRGFRVTIERTVLDGAGHVDVALQQAELAIACEISVTSDPDHELANLQKCLAAGFDYAVLVSANKSTLRKASHAVNTSFPRLAVEQIRLLTPEAMIGFLDEIRATRAGSANTVRGYKVSVTYRATTREEQRDREEQLAQVISRSLGRSRKDT